VAIVETLQRSQSNRLSAATAAAAPATATAMASFLRKKRNIRLVATASGNSSGAGKIKGQQEKR